MATLSQLDGTATISTTPYSLVTNSTTLNGTTQHDIGVLDIWIDFSALAVGGVDEYRVDVYEYFGDEISAQIAMTFPVNSPGIFELRGLIVAMWDVVVTKVTGTDRSIVWSLRTAKYPDDGTLVYTNASPNTTVEWSIPNAANAPSTAQTADGYVQLWLHTLKAGSTVGLWRVRIYEKVNGSTQRTRAEWYLANNEKLVTPIFSLRDGWDVTVEKISGTTAEIEYSLRRYIPPVGGGSGYSRSRAVNA